MIVLFNLSLMAIFLFLVSLCLGLWVASLNRLFSGKPILVPEPRIVPQVGLGELLLGFGVMVLASTLLAPLLAPANADGPTLERTIGLIVLNSIATVLAVLAVLMWLKLQGVSLAASGFLPTFRHIGIGLAGALMILPPVMSLQAILASQIAYEHPLLEVLRKQIPIGVMITMAISASIVAPLVEEFYFRGLMQGWLEKVSVAFRAGKNTVSEVLELPAVSTPADSLSQTSKLPAMMPQHNRAAWPGIITSFMFALVHAGQGPAPISLFFLALGIAYLYKQTGSIWPGIVVHFVLNATATSVMIVTSLLSAS